MVLFNFLRIRVTFTFWLAFLFYSFFINQITHFNWFLIFLILVFSLFIHECVKGIVSYFLGVKTNVVMTALGGTTSIDKEKEGLSFFQNVLIIFSGLLVNLTIALTSLIFIYKSGHFFNQVLLDVLSVFFVLNSFIVFLNLMPVYPFDFGNFISYVLEKYLGLPGMKIATLFSIFSGVSLFFLLSWQSLFYLGFIFLLFSYENIKIFILQKKISSEDIRVDILEKFEKIQEDVENKNISEIESIQKLNEFISEINKGIIFNTANKLLARQYLSLEQYQQAYTSLEKIESDLDKEGLDLLHYSAFMSNEYEKTLELSESVFNYHSDYQIALFNSIAAASLKKIDIALHWLSCSLREGLPVSSEIFSLEEFQSLKTHPIFLKFQKNFT